MGARFRGVLKGILEGNLVLLRHAKECMTPFNSNGPTFFHHAYANSIEVSVLSAKGNSCYMLHEIEWCYSDI